MSKVEESGKSFLRTNFSNRMVICYPIMCILSCLYGRTELGKRGRYAILTYYFPNYRRTTLVEVKKFVSSEEFVIFTQQSTVLRETVFPHLGIPFVTKFLNCNTINLAEPYSVSLEERGGEL